VHIEHQPSPPGPESWALHIETSEFIRVHTVAITRRTRILTRRVATFTLVTALTLAATGCMGPRPLRGGRAVTTPNPPSGLAQTLLQGDNPSASSRQSQQIVRVRTYTLPASSQPSTFNLQPSTPCLVNLQPSTPWLVTDREETHAQTELGAAQKDTARDLAAKLSSLKPTVWVGLALFIFGLASLFWPPLKLIIGSVTTSVALVLGGIALIVLPTLIVGNEPLILAGVAVVVGLWFLAHRHGHLRGMLATSPLPAPRRITTARSNAKR
jgi:hypothetical protein